MRAKQVTKEDAMEFEGESRTYAHVLEHRRKCKKWAKEFCLDCFGGGLTQFTKDLEMEKSLSTSQSEGTELSFKVPSAKASDKPCPECNGKGIQTYKNNMTNTEEFITCVECEGTGKARL